MTIKVQYSCAISLPFGIPTSKWLFPFPRSGMSHYITRRYVPCGRGKIWIDQHYHPWYGSRVRVYRDVMCGTGMVGSQHNQAPQHSNHITRGLVPGLVVQSFRTFPCLVLSHKNKKPTWTCSIEWAQRDQIQRRHRPADVSWPYGMWCGHSMHEKKKEVGHIIGKSREAVNESSIQAICNHEHTFKKNKKRMITGVRMLVVGGECKVQ